MPSARITKSEDDQTSSKGNENIKLKGIEDEGDCGWSAFRPDCIQRFNNPGGYLFVFGMFLVTQGLLVNGYLNVVISTLERRFRLQSFQTGLIVVSYDFAYFLLCLFVTFYGNRGHRPQMLGISSVVFGFGCFLFSIPHFTTDLYQYEGNYSELCDSTSKPPSCSQSSFEEENLDDYFYLFVFAMFLQGFGCICLYTVGFTMIEDSLPKGKSAIYIGIANALTILGPVLGYVVGGYSLAIYVDFDQLEPNDIDLEVSDPRWVGAWWVGFLLATVMSWVLVSLPMLGFPKQFPGSALERSKRESEVHIGASEEITEKEGFGRTIKDMPRAIWLMVRNTPFLFTTLAGCSEGFIVAAFTAFLPKYIESQFSLTAGAAAFYAGVIAIPGGVVGMLLSAFIIDKLQLMTAGILKMCIACCTTVLVMSPICLLYCETPEIAGITVPYNEGGFNGQGNLTSRCNSMCGCQEEYFSPVCGSDNVTYFSSCFAGCAEKSTEKLFMDCSCINASPASESSAYEGLCDESCDALAPFLGVFFFVVMINFMTTTPVLLIVMRCVPESQKSFAIGVQWWIVRALGSIPGPVVFGVIFDATCILWQQSECTEEQGSCWVNDSSQVGMYILTAAVACKALSVISFSAALYVYQPVGKNQDSTEDLKFETAEDLNEEKFQSGGGKEVHILCSTKNNAEITQL